MGNAFGKSNVRLLIAGLDAAGKTTILWKIQRGEKRLREPIATTPTMHFNVAEWQYKSTKFSVWDVGGQDSIRPLWRHHLTGTQGLVFVVDSSDRERVRKAAQELHRVMLDPAMRHACLLVFANKCDLPHALDVDEVHELLQLKQLNARATHVQPSCAHGERSGEGLWRGLKWLAENCKPL